VIEADKEDATFEDFISAHILNQVFIEINNIE
jgi:hypothetical protein